MGQKVNPISLRVGITRTWNSNWFVANKNTYKVFLHEDLKIRTLIKKGFFQSGISKMVDKEILIDIKEIKRPDVDSQLVAENIALQLERRVAYRRAMKRSLTSALRLGAIGIKIMVSGRLNGAEIARSEWYREGRVPLSTLRADIDYGFAEANTTYGKIGIKVWIFKGEVLRKKQLKGESNASA